MFLRGFSITACSKLTVLGEESLIFLEGGGPSSSLGSSLSSSESKSQRRSSRSSSLTKGSISLSESEAEDASGSLELDCWEAEDDPGPLCTGGYEHHMGGGGGGGGGTWLGPGIACQWGTLFH